METKVYKPILSFLLEIQLDIFCIIPVNFWKCYLWLGKSIRDLIGHHWKFNKHCFRGLPQVIPDMWAWVIWSLSALYSTGCYDRDTSLLISPSSSNKRFRSGNLILLGHLNLISLLSSCLFFLYSSMAKRGRPSSFCMWGLTFYRRLSLSILWINSIIQLFLKWEWVYQ